MDIYRATREAEIECETAIDFLQVIAERGLIPKSKKRDKRILEVVIKRLTTQKENLHRFKYEELSEVK